MPFGSSPPRKASQGPRPPFYGVPDPARCDCTGPQGQEPAPTVAYSPGINRPRPAALSNAAGAGRSHSNKCKDIDALLKLEEKVDAALGSLGVLEVEASAESKPNALTELPVEFGTKYVAAKEGASFLVHQN